VQVRSVGGDRSLRLARPLFTKPALWAPALQPRPFVFHHIFHLCHNTLTPAPTEKLEDARAKAAIKAQIELDKQKRAEKAARDKAIRDGQPVPDTLHASSAPQVAVKTAAATAGMKGKDFPETRLQVRLSTGGAPLVKSFKSDAREYRLWVVAGALGFVVRTLEWSESSGGDGQNGSRFRGCFAHWTEKSGRSVGSGS
jgi:hypothetical protein